jgi:3-hydroxyisobutyrate dehydrogenase-like beta-hydroxyacid dehydrogenase
MPLQTVAVLSPGDMGHSVGNVLREGGLQVLTCLRGRGPRSAALADEAGIANVPDYETLVRMAEIVLSIVPPAVATELATQVAAAVRATGARPLFVDCNAISPRTAREIEAIVADAGTRFVDVGIIGSPPKRGERRTHLHASGAAAAELLELREHGLDVRVVGDQAGQASGLKMCYAALTKGLTALATELLVAGERLGLSAPLAAELQDGQGALMPWIERQIPSMPPKAYRWVGEMEEIAATFGELGLPPEILQGAAAMYRLVGETALADETPEVRRRGQTLADVVAIIAAAPAPAGSSGLAGGR